MSKHEKKATKLSTLLSIMRTGTKIYQYQECVYIFSFAYILALRIHPALRYTDPNKIIYGDQCWICVPLCVLPCTNDYANFKEIN